jgi:AcrR family transcriptional regulator
MTMAEQILDVARRLTLERGVVPSLNEVAAAAGVSKGGLVHHFRSRSALVDGLARQALDEIDRALAEAAGRGEVVATWFRLSVPHGEEVELYRAMAVAHRTLESPGTDTVAAAAGAIERWEALIADEVGDPVLARVVRLVGDGLAMNVLAGTSDPPTPAELDRLLQHLLPGSGRGRP